MYRTDSPILSSCLEWSILIIILNNFSYLQWDAFHPTAAAYDSHNLC
jgi:hypothetical protein